jgi:hypothetical protein
VLSPSAISNRPPKGCLIFPPPPPITTKESSRSSREVYQPLVK